MCNHESCGVERRIWVPIDNNLKGEIRLHPWCVHCGLVKNISDDQPYKLGYWMNLLSQLSSRYNIKQVQKRLIIKDLLDTEGFNDIYATKGSDQKELFVQITSKYTTLNKDRIMTFIR